MLTSLIVAIAIVLHPGDVMAKKRVIRRSQPAYGQGLNKLLDQVAPPAQQYASGVAYGAIADADKWWERQGSTPKPVELEMVPRIYDGLHLGTGSPKTGKVQLDAPYVQGVTDILNGKIPMTRHGQLVALAGLWTLVAHERGHNIGYQHQPSGLMAVDNAVTPPGEAYVWAKSMLPQKHKIKFRRR